MRLGFWAVLVCCSAVDLAFENRFWCAEDFLDKVAPTTRPEEWIAIGGFVIFQTLLVLLLIRLREPDPPTRLFH